MTAIGGASSAMARTFACFREADSTGPGDFHGFVETALKMGQSQFVIDGEICVFDVRGISDFDALHSNKHNDEAQLYAFDLLSIGGEDLRDAPLLDRKGLLEKILRGRVPCFVSGCTAS
jgi:bifunctional non-homologous end joining protein LigD